MLDISEIKEACFREATADVITYMTNLVDATTRNRIGMTFITGGGAYQLHQYLEPEIRGFYGSRYKIIRKDSIARGKASIAAQRWGFK